MKRTRVVIETVSGHRVYVESNGERTLYAITGKLNEAKGFVQQAKRELGIARGRKKAGGLLPAKSDV
jgi:hypothetical protein